MTRTTPPRKPTPTAPRESLAPLPVLHPQAAGIDVGDASHWVCVGDATREFPAHTPGLRELVDWLREAGVTTVALEASGAYGHVLFLTLTEAGFATIMTSPAFTRQIEGRPKTDRLDCQWISRLHTFGLLPGVFQPDEATQTLRSHVRQRGNLVRLSGRHIRRMQRALGLMNFELTRVLGDITGVTGLKILRAIPAGERDPEVPAELRDRLCKRAEPEVAQRSMVATDPNTSASCGRVWRCGRRIRPRGHNRRDRRVACVDPGERTRLGLRQMAHEQTLCELAGVTSAVHEDRQRSAIQPHPAGEEPCGDCVASGGVESAAKPE